MAHNLWPFLLHWGITAVSLWVASHLFSGIRFASTGALIVSALLLGLANALVKPLLIVLTLPLTFLTFGLFLLVINALMLLLVSALVRGFTVPVSGPPSSPASSSPCSASSSAPLLPVVRRTTASRCRAAACGFKGEVGLGE